MMMMTREWGSGFAFGGSVALVNPFGEVDDSGLLSLS